ncbi:MAG: hypothetical protein JO222_00895 [Frankiales bacterium]|nr:hypothetical protein [Frankiales bacterium]
MARKPPLRAVKEGEKAEPQTIVEAIEAGNYLAELKLTHLRIGRAVSNPETSPRDLAALTRRQTEISKEIQALVAARAAEEAAEGGTVDDEAWDAEAL